MKKMKSKKGITLIALVVTIVIILILAGITVGMVTSDNGILKETKSAKMQAEIDNEKSIVERAKMLTMMRDKSGKVTMAVFEPALKDEAGTNPTEVSDAGETIEVLFTDSNRYYEVDKDGNVSEPQEVVKDEYAGDITKGGRCDGSEEKPYEISCIEDLVVFSNMSNATGILFENGEIKNVGSYNTFEGKYIILMRNLNFKSKYSYKDSTRTDFGNINGDDTDGNSLIIEMTTGIGFTPIGDLQGSARFCGNFDGNNKAIQNLYIERAEENSEITGFISNVKEGALVKDLTISGKITSKGHTGGIIGESRDKATVINCTKKSDITGWNSVGGIIGFNSGEETTIKNCNNYGNITITDGAYGYTGAGGISGSGVKEIVNCYNYGTISGKHRMGGIVGFMSPSSGILKDCVNKGNVDSGTSSVDCGGIVGKTSGGNWKVQNCINSGNVTGNGIKGGIIGSVSGQGWETIIVFSIENCINIGNINSNESVVGGIVGEQGYIHKSNTLTIKNCVTCSTLNGKIIGGVIGNKINGDCNIENVYYITEPAIKQGTLTSGEATLKSESEIKSQTFVDLLNANIGTNTDWKKWKLGSSGYPTFVD